MAKDEREDIYRYALMSLILCVCIGFTLYYLFVLSRDVAKAYPLQTLTWDPGSSSIANPEAIPTAYRGDWAPTMAECRDPERTNGLYIRREGLTTYETGGRLQQVTRAGKPRSIRLRFAYEGEGSFWQTEEVWTITPDWRRLTIQTVGKTGTVNMVRCK